MTRDHDDENFHTGIKFSTARRDSSRDLMSQIAGSKPFAARVRAGMDWVVKHQAETGFNVYQEGGEKVIFGQLALGRRRALDDHERVMGMDPLSAGVNLSTTEIEDHFLPSDHEGPRPRRVASFHTHVSPNGFSSRDMENYEKDKDADQREDRGYRNDGLKFLGKATPLYHPKDLAAPFITGVIAPKIENPGGRRPALKRVDVLAFYEPVGPAAVQNSQLKPQAIYYQAIDFNSVPLEKQAEILRDSGMRVLHQCLSVVDGKIDFSPLKKTE